MKYTKPCRPPIRQNGRKSKIYQISGTENNKDFNDNFETQPIIKTDLINEQKNPLKTSLCYIKTNDVMLGPYKQR
jgi:hypothetical protein